MPATDPPRTGASQNSHSCDIAQPPTNNAVAVLRAGFTDKLVTGDANEMNQRQPEANRDRRKPLRRVAVRGAENNYQEEKGEHEFRNKARSKRIAAGRMQGVSVRSESTRGAESLFPAGDQVEHARTCRTAEYLGNYIGQKSLNGKRRPIATPTETAGFRWQPEIWPTA